eukprot:SAG22_NODE_668_length_7998_cov_4.353462_7_plen_89_part_00
MTAGKAPQETPFLKNSTSPSICSDGAISVPPFRLFEPLCHVSFGGIGAAFAPPTRGPPEASAVRRLASRQADAVVGPFFRACAAAQPT